jgi:ABC-2 type transport system permease protein
MITKELLEARWKAIIFLLIAIIVSAGNSALYPIAETQLSSENTVPASLKNLVPADLPQTFNAYAWDHWFATNGPFFLGLFAAVLGGSLIASEVSNGSIFFLLSKPVSRDRILLTKYGVSVSLLLVVNVVNSIGIAIVGIILGHTPVLLPLLFATGLLWLGTLFPLGLALFFSVVSPDSLRPVVFSLVITIMLILLPLLSPNWTDWSLLHAWNNRNAYLSGSFPLKEYLVSLVFAVVPLFAAFAAFRQKAY